MKKERLMNLAGVLVFYLIIVLGVVALNARMEYLNNIETPSFYNK